MSDLHQAMPRHLLSPGESIWGMSLAGFAFLGPPKKHQHLLPWANALKDGLQILICL
jgi:hypothetical protein